MVFALIWFAVIAMAFFVLAVLPQRRRVAAQRDLLANLQVGDEVVTGGGLWGRLRSIADTEVGLEIADGVVVRIARAAVVGRAIPEPSGDDGPGVGGLEAESLGDDGKGDDAPEVC
jgi:preprotein translocase subunit YajC